VGPIKYQEDKAVIQLTQNLIDRQSLNTFTNELRKDELSPPQGDNRRPVVR